MSDFSQIFKHWPCAVASMLCLVFGAHPHLAWAAQSETATFRHDRATLITDRDAVGPDQTIHVALRLNLQPGWHTYWKNPGDAGEATTLTVRSRPSRTAASDSIIWPAPSRIPESGLMAYGYEGDTILPVSLHVPGRGSVTLDAHGEWLVCANTCVPEKADFHMVLPAAEGAAPAGKDAALIEGALKAAPQEAHFNARFDASGRLSLDRMTKAEPKIAHAWFVPDATGLIDHMAPQSSKLTDDHINLQLKFVDGQPKSDRISGVVVLQDVTGQQTAYQITARHEDARADGVSQDFGARAQTGWTSVLLYAFIGGLILNLMPCVFPILTMKALSLLKMAHVDRRRQRASALGYALGVILTFLCLAGFLVGLRAAGAEVGWGFQFQSEFFVLFITWLLFLLGLNLFGVFEFTPASINSVELQQEGWRGDIMTGVLAVIVATPCTAPFMGTALAVGLTANYGLAALIFATMGAGLAAPYVVIACFPKLGRLLPKPGAWMAVFKQFLAFPLFGSCVWLLWVAAVQGGPILVLMSASGAVVLGLSAWLFGISQHQHMRGASRARFINLTLALILFVGTVLTTFVVLNDRHAALALRTQRGVSSPAQSSELSRDDWTPERLAALRAAGQPVFVDMTAAWCITCLVNERVALSTTRVKKAFRHQNVVTLVGDWTRKDDRITTYLRSFGRDGVPLYVYYAPGHEGVVLPQILTPALVLNALQSQPTR